MEKLSWFAPEYIHTEKTTDWYWIVAIISISFAIIAIIFGNVIFAILILVSVTTLSMYATRKPSILKNDVTRTGIHHGSTFYSYTDLDSYWVETREIYPKIILKSKKKLLFFIVILIDSVEPEEIDDYLSDFLPKAEHHEPLLEKVFIWMGF